MSKAEIKTIFLEVDSQYCRNYDVMTNFLRAALQRPFQPFMATDDAGKKFKVIQMTVSPPHDTKHPLIFTLHLEEIIEFRFKDKVVNLSEWKTSKVR